MQFTVTTKSTIPASNGWNSVRFGWSFCFRLRCRIRFLNMFAHLASVQLTIDMNVHHFAQVGSVGFDRVSSFSFTENCSTPASQPASQLTLIVHLIWSLDTRNNRNRMVSSTGLASFSHSIAIWFDLLSLIAFNGAARHSISFTHRLQIDNGSTGTTSVCDVGTKDESEEKSATLKCEDAPFKVKNHIKESSCLQK